MQIRPFRGWRYSEGNKDASTCLAPPYDILSADDKKALLSRDERNIVAVDLPHCPPWDVGADEEYEAAARLLRQWQRNGVLVQEAQPALYAYQQTYEHLRQRYVRRAMMAGVRGTPLGQDVLAHEHTRPGPKADRLKLTHATRTQLSPIFGFYEDPSGEAAELLWSAATGEPAVQGTLDRVEEKLWAVTEPERIAEIRRVLEPAPLFIADGHHRYSTALSYRDELLARGVIDAEHEANFVMFAMVPHDDPGLIILPTHRIIGNLKPDFSIDQLPEAAAQFEWNRHGREIMGHDPEDIQSWLGRFGPGTMAMVEPGSSDVWTLRLTDKQAMDKAAADQPRAWRELDVSVLHTLIIDRALRRWGAESSNIEYTPQVGEVIEACQTEQASLGVILQGVLASDVEAVARAGGSMPPKSTFFHPKIATGVVLKPLE